MTRDPTCRVCGCRRAQHRFNRLGHEFAPRRDIPSNVATILGTLLLWAFAALLGWLMFGCSIVGEGRR